MERYFSPKELQALAPPKRSKPWLHFWLITKIPSKKLTPTEANFIPESWARYLNDLEVEMVGRILNREAALDFASTRSTVKLLLGHYNEISKIQEINFTYNENGKPSFGNLAFNLTHCRNYSLLALTNLQTIGVDLEYLEPLPWPKTHAKFLQPQERAELLNLDLTRSLPLFYTLWVRKEAVLKAMGSNLLTGLQASLASSDQQNPYVLWLEPNKMAKSTWLCPLKLQQNFLWSYALNPAEINLDFNPEHLTGDIEEHPAWPDISYFRCEALRV